MRGQICANPLIKSHTPLRLSKPNRYTYIHNMSGFAQFVNHSPPRVDFFYNVGLRVYYVAAG